ncbi:hypothetical protein CDD83_3865 [Cordyceps sp. RAO-2017]|nr:hypothetical protein CDD83_3865 [Cordyceps sp. RAO-2017]
MERLYASGCIRYPSHAQEYCFLLTRIATFAGSQLLCLLTVVCALLNQFVFTHARLCRIYGPRFAELGHADRRRLRLLHVGIVMKLSAFLFVAVPAYHVAARGSAWADTCVAGMTMSDMATVAVFSFGALCLFDFIYDDNLRVIYIMHHVGTLVVMQGTLALVMTLPARDMDGAGIIRMVQVMEITLAWVLFSSLGSTVSRLTYLTRQLLPQGLTGLRCVYLGGLCAYTSLVAIEGVTVICLLRIKWSRLPNSVGMGMCLFQVLFTATKMKTAQRILAVYRNEAETARGQPKLILTAKKF